METSKCPPNLAKLVDKSRSAGVANYLAELLQLSPAELIAQVVKLEARLGAATLNGEDTYQVPADRDFVVFQIQSAFRSTALDTEPVLNANITDFSVDGLVEARLANCLAQLRVKDRKLDIFDNGEVDLGSMRKSPLYFPVQAPLLLPATFNVQAIFTLQDNAAAVAGNDADYGLLLIGVSIPKRV